MKEMEMASRQALKAQARDSAKSAPAADPEIAQDALDDADKRKGSKLAQPVYGTQTASGRGKTIHRDKDAVLSEFENPADHTVKAARTAR